MNDGKPINPKDAAATARVPLHLVPPAVPIYAALAYAEGDLKYGAFNWRATEVKASVYVAAMKRHLERYWNGEWADPVTGVPHLASIIAGCGIILDAQLVGKLIDDRPPPADLSAILAEAEETMRGLQALFGDRSPNHWTITNAPSGADAPPSFIGALGE
ncbi:dATP/dGTP diphosphohydrolase domain-containing protein [Xanthobacter autotrophicus]|uniref:dATP/dGTP diphosphohydrolase domain-containing protein n=1 Tax=Xanthobacter autotrophicus TaxID=280 RepID=UPI0037299A34